MVLRASKFLTSSSQLGSNLVKNEETLSGSKTLTDSSAPIQVLDPNGADRDINLPTVGSNNPVFYITNSATDSTYFLKVKYGGGVIGYVGSFETLKVTPTGTNWTTSIETIDGTAVRTYTHDHWLGGNPGNQYGHYMLQGSQDWAMPDPGSDWAWEFVTPVAGTITGVYVMEDTGTWSAVSVRVVHSVAGISTVSPSEVGGTSGMRFGYASLDISSAVGNSFRVDWVSGYTGATRVWVEFEATDPDYSQLLYWGGNDNSSGAMYVRTNGSPQFVATSSWQRNPLPFDATIEKLGYYVVGASMGSRRYDVYKNNAAFDGPYFAYSLGAFAFSLAGGAVSAGDCISARSVSGTSGQQGVMFIALGGGVPGRIYSFAALPVGGTSTNFYNAQCQPGSNLGSSDGTLLENNIVVREPGRLRRIAFAGDGAIDLRTAVIQPYKNGAALPELSLSAYPTTWNGTTYTGVVTLDSTASKQYSFDLHDCIALKHVSGTTGVGTFNLWFY